MIRCGGPSAHSQMPSHFVFCIRILEIVYFWNGTLSICVRCRRVSNCSAICGFSFYFQTYSPNDFPFMLNDDQCNLNVFTFVCGLFIYFSYYWSNTLRTKKTEFIFKIVFRFTSDISGWFLSTFNYFWDERYQALVGNMM